MRWRVLAHGLAAALLVAGVLAEVVRPLAPGVGPVPEAARFFDPAYLSRAVAYRRPLYPVGLVTLAVRVAVPCVVAYSRRGRNGVERSVERVGKSRPVLAAAVVAVGIAVLTDLALLPLAFWAGFVHEGAFGLRTQGLAGWVRDWALGAVLGWVAVAVLALGGWAVVHRVPRAWPPVAALGATALATAFVLVSPLAVEPLFLRTAPLAPGPVRDEVLRVLDRAEVRADRILVADASRRTTRENAYVTGLGATRRVVLYDTLLAGRSPREVGVVLGHELGHVRHADLARGVLFGGAGTVVVCYGLALLLGRRVAAPNAAAQVVAAIVVASVLALPVEQVVNRRAEAAADLAALQVTDDPATFVDLQVALAEASLGEPSPPAWVTLLWGSHPAPLQRIARGLEWPAP